MMPGTLNEEVAYFTEKKAELLKIHRGQFALIKGRDLIGVYQTPERAYTEGVMRFGRDSFLVQQIVEHEQAEFVPLFAYPANL